MFENLQVIALLLNSLVVRCFCLVGLLSQIYNERIGDLLDPMQKNLEVKICGPFIFIVISLLCTVIIMSLVKKYFPDKGRCEKWIAY